MNEIYPRGAEWRKWDLHIHTPSSVDDYKNKSISNQKIIDTLFKNFIAVAAITDHNCIDCNRIEDLQKIGKDKNITIFPGIELLSDARGDQPVHFIGIFSEDCNLKYIWGQLENKTNLKKIKGENKKVNSVYCDLVDTIKLIKELGGIVSIHAGQKSNTLESITNSLLHTMAQKADIAKIVDIFELGKEEDQAGYNEKVFPCIRKILPMIICSDNHNIDEYHLKQNCWIKADPIFEGLKQVINEPEGRVFIGEKPYILRKVESNKTKFINKVTIRPVKGYDNKHGKWFENSQLEFNKELIAVIGNKGSGKSALADIIALCGNYKDHDNFSFLKKDKFIDGKLAQNFESTLIWEDENTNPFYRLDKIYDEKAGLLERVKYLPQGYFETLCNEINNANAFKKEIENVVFQHLEEEEKYNYLSFNDLINWKKATVEREISLFKDDLFDINKEIIKLEKKENQKYKLEIQNKIIQKENELKALKEPEKVNNPNADPTFEEINKTIIQLIDSQKSEIEEIEEKIEIGKQKKITLTNEIDELKRIRGELELSVKEVESLKSKIKQTLYDKYRININDVIKIETDYSIFSKLITKKDIEIKKVKLLLGEADQENKLEYSDFKADKNLIEQLEDKNEALKKERCKLDEPQKKYQIYLADVQKWEKQKKAIEGDGNKPDTLGWLQKEKIFLETELIIRIKKEQIKRIGIVEKIFNKKEEIISIYKTVKRRIDDIIVSNKAMLKGYEINIDASLSLTLNFKQTFFNFVNQKIKGSFYGIAEGDAELNKILITKDIGKKEDLISILNSIIEHLKKDKRETYKDELRFVDDQISDIEGLYEYLFSLDYLDYNYELKLGEKNLEILSPGEKGALLLVFYLFLDKSEIPLILDQPEDNLDNLSIANILVPFIKEAKKKRQIIMVTHNPNLAVVADAEQIIYVNIDKKNENKFSFDSGSIENKEINRCVVNVLEGAMPAFNQRKRKYYE